MGYDPRTPVTFPSTAQGNLIGHDRWGFSMAPENILINTTEHNHYTSNFAPDGTTYLTGENLWRTYRDPELPLNPYIDPGTPIDLWRDYSDPNVTIANSTEPSLWDFYRTSAETPVNSRVYFVGQSCWTGSNG